jgi:membrane protein DedA with SNARE-associated domain
MFESNVFINHFPYLGVFLLIILGGIGLPFPEDTTLILSGFLVAHDVIKPIPAFLVIYPGLLITDFFLYWMGRKYGRMLVEHKRFQRIISSHQLSKLEERFKKRGVWVVLVGRHFLGLRAQIFLVAGVMRMSPVKFLVADASTALLTIALMGGIGYEGGNSIRILKKDFGRIEHLAIAFFMILIAGWFVLKYFKGYKKLKGR